MCFKAGRSAEAFVFRGDAVSGSAIPVYAQLVSTFGGDVAPSGPSAQSTESGIFGQF